MCRIFPPTKLLLLKLVIFHKAKKNSLDLRKIKKRDKCLSPLQFIIFTNENNNRTFYKPYTLSPSLITVGSSLGFKTNSPSPMQLQ
jgi:hypothetical protein